MSITTTSESKRTIRFALFVAAVLLCVAAACLPSQAAYAKAGTPHAAMTDGASWASSAYKPAAVHADNATQVAAGHTVVFNFAFEKGRYVTGAALHVKWKGEAAKTIKCKKHTFSSWAKASSGVYYRMGRNYAQVKIQNAPEGVVSWYWDVAYSKKSYKSKAKARCFAVAGASRTTAKRSVSAAKSAIRSLAVEKGRLVHIDQLELGGSVNMIPTRALGCTTIKLTKASYGYTGSAITPRITVERKGVALQEGADYTLTCVNNKKIGTATATLTGQGDYYGSVSVRFAVTKGANPLTVTVASKSYTREALAAKAHSFTIGAKKGVGKVTYSRSKVARVAGIKVSSKGEVTIPAGNYIYDYPVYVNAAGNEYYKAAKVKVVVTAKAPAGLTAVVERAKAELGKPYGAGGVGPAYYDCSGFAGYCASGKHKRIFSTYDISKHAKVIPASKAVPGDIVCRSVHAGIYIGNGLMIHASQPGDVVKISKVEPGMKYYRFKG